MEFEPFRKIARLSREVIITEKIDGTNGCIGINEDGSVMWAGSRSRWLVEIGYDRADWLAPDNFGFGKWVITHADSLRRMLGPGLHYGEWWGLGIQRGYGLTEKRFSLFNTSRWGSNEDRPSCCHVVPVLWRGEFDQAFINGWLNMLAVHGSYAAPGFMKPEGIVIFHAQGNVLFKKTLVGDDRGKEHGA